METHLKRDQLSTVCLVRDAQGGNRQALESLFERYLPRVRHMVNQRLGGSHQSIASEDIVQDTLMKAFKAFRRFEPRPNGSFRKWIACCVHSALIDRARADQGRGRDRVKVLFLDGDACGAERITGQREGDQAAMLELESELCKVLRRLPERYRQAVVLRYLHDLSYPEVARNLGIARVGTAQKVVARGIERLRILLHLPHRHLAPLHAGGRLPAAGDEPPHQC